MQRRTLSKTLVCLATTALLMFTVMAGSAPAQNISGHIFTTFSDGGTVNGNLYPSKDAVYLNGGPQNTSSAGLPDGLYYYQVTNPNGDILLSTDDISCRQVVVSGGIFVGVPAGPAPAACLASDGGAGNFHNVGTPDAGNGGSIGVQLCAPSGCPAGSPDFNDTPNKGGEYKVWITPQDDYNTFLAGGNTPDASNNWGFISSNTKTDNFKVRVSHVCTPDNNGQCASVTVCKFHDLNANGIHDGNEELLSGWTIDAVNATGDGSTVKQTTDSSGCTTFNITGFSTTPQIVTLTEELQAGWTETAPLDGTYLSNVTVSHFVITAPVNPGDDITAPDFGNTGVDLTVSKTATPAFTRTYNWSIQKLVDKTLVEQFGGTVTFNYTVNVAETGFVDSGWQVTGQITVTNPNIFAVSGINVTDAVDDGGTCVVTGGTGVSLAAGGSTVLSYTCTYASAPNPTSGTNTATATWDNTIFFTPHNSATGTATFSFTTPTSTVNKTVTVTDNFNGTTTTLGTVTATDSTPFASKSFTYSHTVSATPGTCSTFNNTATIAETGQTSSQSVTVCNTNTGALTMGFWQNKNGQGIITSYCGGTSGISLAAFLTSYNPFKDMTATTCSGEASYVLNVIKNAACTSTSKTCNTMLKAQMLATALDVYFSTPSLGGNRIGAFNGLGSSQPPLGGVGIDLSHICNMIDGTSGSSCTGVFEDARPEFGIASSCKGATVATMLAYSNFLSAINGSPVSNVGGTTWYLQIKNPNQVFAKDAFDNTNNQVAGITTSTCASTF